MDRKIILGEEHDDDLRRSLIVVPRIGVLRVRREQVVSASQSPSDGIQFGQGISINVSPSGAWIVRARGDEFPLEEMTDFFRAWILLERPFGEVKALLDCVARDAHAATPFPVWKLVGSAFKGASRNWTELAMAWVPHLSLTEKTFLENLLVEVRDSKWVSQKSRHVARKVVTEIERSKPVAGMTVTLHNIRQAFDDLIGGALSREAVADFAARAMKAHDAGVLDLEHVDADRLWKAILYLRGVDLMTGRAAICTPRRISSMRAGNWDCRESRQRLRSVETAGSPRQKLRRYVVRQPHAVVRDIE